MVPEILSSTDRIFCHFGLLFALFAPTNPKNQKFWKTEKKLLEISSFYTSVPKIMIICYTVPEIWHVTDVIVTFHFGLFFTLLAPKQLEKSKFYENEKNARRYHQFKDVYQKLRSDDTRFLRNGAWRTDRLTDGRTERVT